MKISLLVSNIVIVGEFNLRKFDKFFFIKNNIFAEEEILDNSIFNDININVKTSKYNLILTPTQCSISLINMDLEDDIHLIANKIVAISDISAKAIGINYQYYMFTEGNLVEISKKYFYHDGNPLLTNFFNTEDTVYGYYVSKDFKDARLKLDIKPASVTNLTEQKVEEILLFSFNFHIDVNEINTKDFIIKNLNEASEYLEESRKIMSIYEQ